MCVVGMQWGIGTTRIVDEDHVRRKGFWLMGVWRGMFSVSELFCLLPVSGYFHVWRTH